MALEDLTGTKYIDSLNSSNPTATDAKSEGDDHIRGIKNVLKTTFPNVSGAVTSTHTELNLLDGVTATTAELNILDGVTSTTAELNILDGVTATTAEINKLDGVTATTAELNIVDGVTATAAELNRVDGTLLEVQNKLQIFSGYVDSSAASAVLPSGWFVSKSVTGQYQITHNINLATPASDLIVTANIVSNGSVVDRYCTIQNAAALSFYVYVRDESSAALADNAFYFIAIQRV